MPLKTTPDKTLKDVAVKQHGRGQQMRHSSRMRNSGVNIRLKLELNNFG